MELIVAFIVEHATPIIGGGLALGGWFLDKTLGAPLSKWGERTFSKPKEEAAPALPPPPPAEIPPVQSLALTNLPPRNPHFVGRVDLLESLDRQLRDGAVALTALSGLGGIGKSQTALHYAHTRTGLKIAWWLRAERPETMLGDLADLARRLGVAPEGNDVQMQARAALDELSRRDNWLLIYDNAETEKDVQDWLPQGHGAVIITSRHGRWHHARKLEVDRLAREDSVRLLLDLSGDTDGAVADALAGDLDDLPLALEQAAAFTQEAGWSLATYRAEFATRHAELLALGECADYPSTVATTWEISVRRVEEKNPGAGQLLTLCAFLAADDIPLDLLRPGADKLPSPLAEILADPVRTAQAVAALTNQSLVKAKDDRLSLHRLVQRVQRNRLDEASRKDWAARAVRLLGQWVVRGGKSLGPLAPDLVSSLGNLASVYWQLGQLEEARVLFQKLLGIVEAHFGADHPRVALRLDNLSNTLHTMGKLPLCRRALSIDTAHYGADHPRTVLSRKLLAEIESRIARSGGAAPSPGPAGHPLPRGGEGYLSSPSPLVGEGRGEGE